MQSNRTVRIALVGDFDPKVIAHQAIPLAVARAAGELDVAVEPSWVHTTELRTGSEDTLARYAGVWCVPGSPYADTEGALAAIRFARESSRPFLGTCGGFQHALLEYARNVCGLPEVAHAELQPNAPDPLIVPLSCALVEQRGQILFVPNSKLAAMYGASTTVEEYHCRYGLAPGYEDRLCTGPLRVTGRDEAGQIRAVELDDHPFFVATLFQPERAALLGRTPPIVRGFVNAAAAVNP